MDSTLADGQLGEAYGQADLPEGLITACNCYAMGVEEMVGEEMVSEEIVMEEMVMEEMVMEEMVMEEVVLVMQDSYCHVGSMLAQTRPEVPMAEE